MSNPSQSLVISAPRHRALLGYLALHADGVRRDQIAELLWGEKSDRQARQSLRQAILSIRKDFGSANSDLLETEGDLVRLNLQKVKVDVQDFLLHANSNSPFSLGLAADIYKGDFFGSFTLGSETFDTWLNSTRERLKIKAAELFEHQIRYLDSEGQHSEALAAAERLVSLDRTNEASQRLLIRQIAAHRGPIAASEHASVFTNYVSSHYGTELEPETLHLVASLRASSSAGSRMDHGPPGVSRKVTLSPDTLESERKLVTVLLASMDMRKGGDPEEEWLRLDPILRYFADTVRTYGGLVNQFTHNGIMALFGAPEARENHAVDGCLAALKMLEAKVSSDNVVGREAPQIRVAISSGEVVVRVVPNDLHVDYAAIGETTQIVKRLEHATPAGRILISRSTRDLACGFVKVRPFRAGGPASLTTELYELTGSLANDSRLRGATASGFTPFVGRVAELDRLRDVLQKAERGQGQVVALVGEPGVGKSRTCSEFVGSGMATKCLVMHGHASSFGPVRSLLPFIEMLRAYFKILDSDDLVAMRLKVRNGVLAQGGDVAQVMSSLLSLLDIPVDDEAWQQISPAQRRRQMLGDIGQFVLRLSRKRSLIIMVENLHWIDEESDLLLERLVRDIPHHRILLLLSYRPEFTNRWLGVSHCHEIRLEPFDEASSRELIARLLGDHQSLAPLIKALLKRTDGNPMFIEESARLLITMGLLSGKRGAVRIIQGVPNIHLPSTVLGLLADRIDRLSKEDKRLLQTAAVVGRQVRVSFLADIAEMSQAALREGLTRLETADFLRPLPSSEPTYIFKHNFTHDVTYRGILQNRRRDLHARISSAMEATYAERLDEHVEQVGYHAFKGELWKKAVQYLRRAGLNAANRSQNQAAKALFETALLALARLPKTQANSEQSVDIRLELRNALLSMADQVAAERVSVEACKIATDLADSNRLGRIMACLSTLYMTKGDLKGARSFGARAIAQGDVGNKALGLPAMALGMQSMGQHAEAIALFRETIALASGSLLYERFGQLLAPSVFGHAGLAIGLAETGWFEEAIEVGKRGVQIAEARHLPVGNLGYALAGVGRAHLRQGNMVEAELTLERGVRVCREFDIPYYEVVLAPQLASAYLHLGKPKLAIELLGQVKRSAERMNMNNMYPLIIAGLSEALVETGDIDRAKVLAKEALDWTRTQHQRGVEAGIMKLLADIAARRSKPVLAERLYKEGLLVATGCGMRPLLAHCHFGLAKLRGGTGDPSGDHLRFAIDYYKEMGMAWWLERAHASFRKAG